MSSIPTLRARDVIHALKKSGFQEERQKGSHLLLVHPRAGKRTVVPVHAGRTIKKPLLRAIIHEAGLTVEEFLELL